MAVVNQSHSIRESYDRRDERVEEAAKRENERTVKAADEHRQAVMGDAHAEGREQRVAVRHQQGAEVNSMGVQMMSQSSESGESAAAGGTGRRNEGGKRKEA